MTKEIHLSSGKVALVDDADYDWLNQWKWSYVSGSAARATSRKDGPQRLILMYRLIMQAPDGMEVDHKNMDRLDCRRENLRLATHTQNMRNRNAHSHNRSGFKGVSPTGNRYRNFFKAEIKVAKRKIYLGCFETAEEAARAYDEKAKELFGEFARTNF